MGLKESEDERVDGEVQFLTVITTDAKESTETDIAVVSDGLTTIAIPVERNKGRVRILPLGSDVPRLFCDFPLLGTETFPFPVIINNPTFNPTEPRDGVVLTKNERTGAYSDENRTIITEAFGLYLTLLEEASTNKWDNLHLLAAAHPMPAFEWADKKWYTTAILKPMQAALLQTKIVLTAAGTIAPIHSPDGKHNIWFPSNSKEDIRERIWNCCSTWFPSQLPAEADVYAWYDIIWHECNRLTLDQVAEFIEADDTIKKLDGELADGTDVHEWLNAFYATLKLSNPEFLSVVAKRRIFPNQNGTFKKKAELAARDAGDIAPALLDILKLLGTDLRDILLDPAIDTILDDLPPRDGGFVVNQITAAVSKIINDQNAMDQRRPALSALLVWFHQHPKSAKKLFPNLYEQKHRLVDDETMIENAKQADQLKQLLSRFNVRDVDELQAVIEKHAAPSPLLSVTQQIIASLGITSLEEWEKALEDKDLAALFPHEPKTTRAHDSSSSKCRSRAPKSRSAARSISASATAPYPS